MAGAALSKLGGFLLLLEGSSQGKKGVGCGEVREAKRMILVEGRVLGREEGEKEEQVMRVDEGWVGERKGNSLC